MSLICVQIVTIVQETQAIYINATSAKWSREITYIWKTHGTDQYSQIKHGKYQICVLNPSRIIKAIGRSIIDVSHYGFDNIY